MNIAEALARLAAARPAAVALLDDERSIGFGELHDLVRRGAAWLRAHGIAPGDPVAVCLGDHPDNVVAFLAAARLGAPVVPIDWRAAGAEQARIAERLGVKLALRDRGAPPLAGVATAVIGETWHDALRKIPPDGDFPDDPDAPLMFGLTSGTTGPVKGIVTTHRQMYRRADALEPMISRRPLRFLSAAPLAFSAGRNFYLAHLLRGHTVLFLPPLFAAEDYVEVAHRTAASAGFVVPTVLRWLIDIAPAKGHLLPQMELLICGGAPTRAEEKSAALRRVTPNFHEVFGTVAAGPISVLRPADMVLHAGSAGRPAPLWTVEIVDEAGRVLAAGATGLLRLRGAALSSGLHASAAGSATGESFRDGWYYSGDLATLDAAGFLTLKGRATDVILRGGTNIYPDEIESVLLDHPDVAAAAAVGRPSPELGEEVVAFVVPRAAAIFDAAALVVHCRARLSPYKVPRAIIRIDALPRTTFGKVDRQRLVALSAAG